MSFKRKIFFASFMIALAFQIPTFGMVPHKGTDTEQLQTFSIFAIFQQLFSIKTADSTMEELIQKLTTLRTKDQRNQIIIDMDVNEVKTIWDQYKSLHNHNWLDWITNPFKNWITNPFDKEASLKSKKNLAFLCHSDRYEKQNRRQMDSVFQHINNISRPDKATDPILCVTSDIVIDQSIILIVSLTNKIFPRLFRSRSSENECLQYDKAINASNQEIDHYKNKTKSLEQKIHNKYLLAKNFLNISSMQDKIFKN
ncbi:MAG TPA: hypothetical protein VKR54_05095 [Candidatus Babeliales bacterium]|jgi:hypothetical protein|nr:hypothetical protein [Candidatus Babeliales bacterium]